MKEDGEGRELPLCLWEPHRKAGVSHYLKHFKECPSDEKKRIRDQLGAEKPSPGLRPGLALQNQHAPRYQKE